MYQVEASNGFGSAWSPYRVGRTREGGKVSGTVQVTTTHTECTDKLLSNT